MMLNGILLLNADSAYQYPPEWTGVIDNDNFDLIIILAGVLLFISSFADKKSEHVTCIIDGVNAAFLAFTILETLIHAYCWHQAILLSTAIFMGALLAIFLYTVYKK